MDESFTENPLLQPSIETAFLTVVAVLATETTQDETEQSFSNNDVLFCAHVCLFGGLPTQQGPHYCATHVTLHAFFCCGRARKASMESQRLECQCVPCSDGKPAGVSYNTCLQALHPVETQHLATNKRHLAGCQLQTGALTSWDHKTTSTAI